MSLRVISAGPACQIQDLGRPGWHRFGVPEGGAMDTLAVFENAALLSQSPSHAVIEIAGFGGEFEAIEQPLNIALTGAPMQVSINGAELQWNSSHKLLPGQVLKLGGVLKGRYGYLGIGGGILTEPQLGARSTHAKSRIGGMNGACLAAGDRLPTGVDSQHPVGLHLPVDERFDGGEIRILAGPQDHLFEESEKLRFTEIEYTVDHRADRMAIRLLSDAPPLSAGQHLSGISDAVMLGNIQIPGDGLPAVLMADRQTTGGYPRIATVIRADLPRMAQASTGANIRFRFVNQDEAIEALQQSNSHLDQLPKLATPLIRDLSSLDDLLAYNLVSGVIADENLPWEDNPT